MLNPNVFSDTESTSLFKRLVSDLDWQEHSLSIFGKLVKQPRLTAWYGDPGRSYEYSGLLLHPLAWTPDLLTVKETCEKFTGHQFNSVLANLYRNGKDSVAWHADGPRHAGAARIVYRAGVAGSEVTPPLSQTAGIFRADIRTVGHAGSAARARSYLGCRRGARRRACLCAAS